MKRVKLISADGSWQYIQVAGLLPEIYLRAMPLLKATTLNIPEDYSITRAHRRKYILYGQNDNGIYIYREDI